MTKPTALAGDVFAGLFTLGVTQAGFDVLGALEHSGYGVATARLNFPKLDFRIGPARWKPEDFRGRVDFMFTNPPCAAWSSMNVGGGRTIVDGWKEDTARLGYVRNLVTAGRIVAPRAWAWESVTNAWRHGRDFVMEVAETWVADGYHVTVLLQNNKFLGGNQHRPRMFVIAHRHPLIWQPTVAPPTLRELLSGVRPVEAADPHHPDMAQSLKKLWKLAPRHGHVLRRALLQQPEADQARLRPRPAMTVNRCRWDQTPGVFIGASKRLHPDEPRTLNWPEILAVCGLPPTWRSAQRSLEPASLECSRAVMPGVGRWLAKSVAAGLRKPALATRPHVRLFDLTDPERPVDEVLYNPAEAPHAARRRAERPVWPPADAEELPPPREPRAARPSAPGQRRLGSGYRTRQLLAEGKLSYAQIVEVIHREFPESVATVKDVYWNKRKLQQQGGKP